jgi:hypothetical protein
MIEISETLVDAYGDALSEVTVVVETLGAPWVADGTGLVAATRRNVITSTAGLIEMELVPGRYRMSWPAGTQVSQWVFVVPYTGGPYLIRHLAAGDVEAWQRQGWRFAGINDALIQFQNATTGNWHSPVVDGAAGSLSLGFGSANNTDDGPNWKDDGSSWWMFGRIGGGWHCLSIGGTDSAPTLQIGAAGVAIPDNHRIKNGRHQFKNLTTSRYHSLFVSGSAGSETYSLGPGEP